MNSVQPIAHPDLFDIQKLQDLMTSVSQLSGVASAVVDTDGIIIASSGWLTACTDFHRSNSGTCSRCLESDTSLMKSVTSGVPFAIYRCLNGLVDTAAPIVVAGKHVATVFAGQFLTEAPHSEFFRKQAREFGFDETSYLAAISMVPVISQERAESITRLYAQLAGMLAANGQDRLTEKRRAADLVVANEELVFQNKEKGQRAAELVVANNELIFQNQEKEKRAGELIQHLEHLEELVLARTSALAESRDAAEAANVAKSRFLATMSHEIRTPMNGILGMAQMLMMPDLEEAERLDYTRTILNSGQTLLTLLNDILDLSRVEAGRFELESIAFEPEQILHEERSLFSDAAGAKRLRIETAWRGPSNQRYLGDPHRLRQMLSNLLNNAIKFTLHGQIRIEVSEFERDEKMAVLEFAVADTGVGIPKEKQILLFQPFTQADSSTTREYGGSGLGLSIVRGLATLMGGDVGIESEVGQGSRIWFRIRAGLVSPGMDSRVRERQPNYELGREEIANRLAGRVLVVEDDKTNRKVIEALLNRFGLTVVLSEDGRQAVERLERGELVDLILMDIQMPVMDGYEATNRIRRWEKEKGNARLPIVALTANAFETDRQHSLAAGMDDYVSKPIAIDTLKAVVSKWLHAGIGRA